MASSRRGRAGATKKASPSSAQKKGIARSSRTKANKTKPSKEPTGKGRVEPLLLLIKPNYIAETDYDRLMAWERHMTERFGFNIDQIRKQSVSKTYETCGSWEFDYIDMD